MEGIVQEPTKANRIMTEGGMTKRDANTGDNGGRSGSIGGNNGSSIINMTRDTTGSGNLSLLHTAIL